MLSSWQCICKANYISWLLLKVLGERKVLIYLLCVFQPVLLQASCIEEGLCVFSFSYSRSVNKKNLVYRSSITVQGRLIFFLLLLYALLVSVPSRWNESRAKSGTVAWNSVIANTCVQWRQKKVGLIKQHLSEFQRAVMRTNERAEPRHHVGRRYILLIYFFIYFFSSLRPNSLHASPLAT